MLERATSAYAVIAALVSGALLFLIGSGSALLGAQLDPVASGLMLALAGFAIGRATTLSGAGAQHQRLTRLGREVEDLRAEVQRSRASPGRFTADR